MSRKPGDARAATSPQEARQQRLAEALRANLGRRKAQQRARVTAEEASPAGAGPTTGEGVETGRHRPQG